MWNELRMRLFAALLLPSRAVERLLSLRLRYSDPSDGMRWSTPQQWHIPLHYFGDLEPRKLQALERDFLVTSNTPVAVALEELEVLVTKGILYAAAAPAAPLLSLRSRLQQLAGQGAPATPTRPFRVQVTLARSRGRQGHRTLAKLGTPHLPPFGPAVHWTAHAVTLLESTLSPHGALYTPQATLALGA